MTFLGIGLLEWFGYAASVVVAVSLMMASIVKLRWYNLVGASMFTSYGFLIGALPVGFLNLFIVLIDIWYLIRMQREKADFKVFAMDGAPDFHRYWMECHREDIQRFFPGFSMEAGGGRVVWYLLKDAVPIGLLVGERRGSDFVVELDYVGPAWRDFRMGRYLYQDGSFFRSQGITRLVCAPRGPEFDRYLERMGFSLREGQYEKSLGGA